MTNIIDLIKQILFKESEVFIGNIIHSPWPYEVKQNEWGGFNFKYKVPDGFKVETIDDSGFHQSWEEIESLSIHTEIPAYLVTYTMPNGSCKDIICSPKNSILIYDDKGEIVKADLRKDLCVGRYTPCKMKNKKNTWISKAMIISVDYMGESMTMYDITLKNNKIFLADDSLFVYDTVATHIPIGREAIEEAKKIMPSYQLYDDVSGKVILMPDHNAAVGLYLLSKTDKGREKINSVLPENLKISSELKKPALAKILADMAKADTKEASKAIDFLRKLGDDTAYEQGVSFGISDIAPMKDIQEETVKNIREEIRHLSSKEKTNDKINAIYKKHADIATDKIEKRFNADPNNKLGVFLLSRARGSASQIRDIVIGPLGVQSANQTEIPISHSYAEGLTPAEAFIAAEGARKGVIGKSQETAMPGALGKEVLMTTNTIIINKQKGNSMNVIELSTDNPNDILDRYTGRDIDLPDGTFIPKDSPVDTRLLKILYKNKIDKVPVYTPLQSSSRDGGLPAMAYGNMRGNSLPEVGFNIGSNSSHGIVKPLFTESMASFHTGGSLQDKMRGYPRLKHILEMTKEIPSKATLSDVDGTVESIERDSVGGYNVYIENQKHYLAPGIEPLIKIGDVVKRGDTLNDGLIDPRDLFEKKSLLDAQNYMVDEIIKNVPSGMRRRAAEVVVEAITRHGEVIDGGDSEFLPGDKVLIPEIEAQNVSLENKVKYKPLFKGVNLLPQNTQSWMAQLNFRNLDKTMKEAVMFGKTTNTHSYEPVPAIATGKDFGKGENGKY